MTFEAGGVVPSIIVLATVLATIAMLAFDQVRRRRLEQLVGRVDDLEGALNREREERRRDKERCDDRIKQLKSQVDTLSGPFAAKLAEAVAVAFRERMDSLAVTLVETVRQEARGGHD